MSPPPRDVFAAATRKAIEVHDEWDAPHWFQTLHWDGTALTCRTCACIMPDIDPLGYPKVMAGIAREELEKYPDDPAYGYLLQIEGFGVTQPPAGAAEAEREQFDRDRIGRTFHERPDAVEAAYAYAADIHGRVWCATHTRADPDRIDEAFYPPGRTPAGQMIRGLIAVAYGTGVIGHGLPGPQGAMN
jgi:hypothetical protein